MNNLAHLRIGDNTSALYNKEYLVVECVVHSSRGHNSLHPCTVPTCEQIEITIVAPGKTDLEFQNWYLGNTVRSGKLSFDLADVQSGDFMDAHTIVFEDASCFSYSERYDVSKRSLRLLTIRIRPQSCTMDGVTYGKKEDQ